MNIFTAALLLILGFVLLIKGADFFVDGASSVAKKLRVPSIIIGFTIVAMGTSLPECAVSVTASLANNNALAISNVVGSNIFNLMVVCGCASLFAPLAISKSTLKKEFPFSVLCALLLLLFGYTGASLSRMEGIIFLVIFACYILWMIYSALKSRQENEEEIESLPTWKCIVFIVGGAIAIKYGGDFVVNGASFIASKMGLSQNLIGLTIVALGTSLPELVTSVVAARKDEVDMALGNAIGSNIFNILLVLGVAGAISPVAFIMENMVDIILLMIMCIIVWIMAWTKQSINKKEGLFMILIYVVYLVYICMR
ncbi:MAG: calcium/sodium antiporter [Erysipelotrichaceae bacterium]|uniref:calcium/sodium antiporter n=1 Tax=Floccifex sp. TaxID=2815810 RepID=UPI002A760B79|nr:calcium/sodium antiporter [Floccifex sp.]MDD7281417.1 calcium/sodium antiporter [Erysipelotrichaceae bacterium]MDY2959119.1 calcium/sodium antiporter [Floccifex sp.]